VLLIKQITTNAYEKDFKLMIKRGKNPYKLLDIVNLLLANANNGVSHHSLLPSKYRLHKIHGKFNGRFECHIEPD